MAKAETMFTLRRAYEKKDFNLYARPIPKCEMSIFQQHSHKTFKYCSNVIYEPGHKLASLQWEIGASLICYRINKSSKPL